MLTINQIITYFLAALLAGAALITGVIAVDNALTSYIAARKDKNAEICAAKLALQKPELSKLPDDDINRIKALNKCKSDEDDDVKAKFALATQYVSCIRGLVELVASTAPGTEPSSSAVSSACPV